MLGLYSSIVGKKRSDYDDLRYPRSRTAPGWFTSGTGQVVGDGGWVSEKIALADITSPMPFKSHN